MPREPEGLTERQERVLELLATGKTNGAIARELGISVSTVRGHLESIYRKLQVTNRTEAVAVWLRRKLGGGA